MRIFISWSGRRSQLVAEALRDWLPVVLQSTEPWLSSTGIEKGTRWLEGITRALSETHLGIVCLTPENLNAAWLHFEAGALSKINDQARLHLYCLGVRAAEISGPLSQYQAVQADRKGTWRLLESLNSIDAAPKLDQRTLEKVFALWWPELEQRLLAIPVPPTTDATPARSLDSKIDRILEIVESLSISPSTPPPNLEATAKTTPGHSVPEPTRPRPRAFIASSSEAVAIAQAIQELLDPFAECTIWNQSVFAPSRTYSESFNDARLLFDFAILVLTPDDTSTVRGETSPAPRDNLLFELGLFSGALGRARTFLVLPAESPPRLPSDLSGVTTTVFRKRTDGNLVAALGPAVSQIRRAMGIADAA